jgi:hypothetical protein
MAHRWTYIFGDLVTNRILGQVPLSGVSLGSQLNAAGQFSATVKLSDPMVRKAFAGVAATIGGTIPTARTIVYVDLDGALLPESYIVWGTSYDSPTQVATLTGVGVWSYYSQRVLWWGPSYTNEDQLSIVEDLFYQAQSKPGGGIGLIGSGALSGVPISVAFDPSQLITIDRAVQTLATQSDTAGFDYSITAAYDVNHLPAKTLTLAYPRSGRVTGSTNLTVDAGESTSLGYVWTTDSTQQAITGYGVGAGSGPNAQLRADWHYGPLITAGYPQLDGVLQRSDITDPATLAGVSRTWTAARAYPVELPVITVGIDSQVTPFGSYAIGDDFRVVIPPDPWFVNGVDEYLRLIAMTVTPGDEGVGKVALTFTAPPVEGANGADPVRTYPSSLPAGVSLLHTYDGYNQTYNLGALTGRWATARNAAYAGTGVARLNWIGDSIPYGAYNTPPWSASPVGQLRQLLVAGGYGNPGTGIEMFYGPGVSSPDPRVFMGGFVDSTNGPVATSITASGTPADFYLTPGIAFDSYTFWYYGTPGGGTFTYQLFDIGATFPVVTVSTNKAAGWYAETNTATGSATGTVYVNVVSGPVTFTSWEASNGAAGVKVGRLAEPGMTAHTVAATALTPTFSLPGAVADLAVIQLEINDYAAQSLTYQADLTSLVTSAQGVGSSVLLVVTQADATLLTKLQSDYSKAIYAVADAQNCAVVDIFDRWDPYVLSRADYLADGVIHPSNTGAADLAAAVYAAIR